MKKIKLNLLMTIFCLLFLSCATPFYKGGYMFKKNSKDYFGNDNKKIYVKFSDKYIYDRIGFNANQLSTNDLELAEEFKVEPKQILFSYHSNSGKEVMTFLLNKNQVELDTFTKESDGNSIFYFKTSEKANYVYRENVYPFQNKFIKIIEKSPNFLDKNGRKIIDDKTRIFPIISDKKPD
jgi:hypothetical protein